MCRKVWSPPDSNPAGRHCSSFTTLRLSLLRPRRKKAARNAPKCHYSRLCRAGVFVPMVARPIQGMSEVPITHKAVGIRLPRLWFGAITSLTQPLWISQNRCPPILPLCTWWGWVAAACDVPCIRPIASMFHLYHLHLHLHLHLTRSFALWLTRI